METAVQELQGMSAVTVPNEKKNVLVQRAQRLLSQAQAFTVACNDDYEMGAGALESIAQAKKEVHGIYDPLCDATYRAWKTNTGARAEVLQPLETAEALLKNKALAYQREQERLRLEEQNRLQREEEARQAALIEEQVEEAEAQGATPEEVAAIIEQAPPPPPVYVAPAVPKVAGVTTRQNWTAEVVNVAAFMKAEAAKPGGGVLGHPSVLKAINSVLAQMAKAQKSTLKLEGVRVWDAGGMAVRS